MWWRAAALDALQAYIAGPLASAPASEQGRLQRTLTQLLAPTLEAITSQGVLQVDITIELPRPDKYERAVVPVDSRFHDLPSCTSVTFLFV